MWSDQCARIAAENVRRLDAHAIALAEWQSRRREFDRRQAESNAAVDRLATAYHECAKKAVEQYCELVLGSSTYPESFPQSFDCEYLPAAKLLVVDYRLPMLNDMPALKSAKYVAARDDIVETPLAEAARKKLHESALYQIVIRTLHELFAADAAGAVDAVACNGQLEGIDPATGNVTRACVLSVQVAKADFLLINLAAVDPKACFRRLKGRGSPQLDLTTPVPPIVAMTREDVRFVEGRNVITTVTEGTNLAAMDWEDFEHLIRDLFEREFAITGGEVRVTQASRDGGIDAVVFDPDPIRGGKFVIQAKRYTNVVGVSAVRDLYGAMINEGAVKGILVTTSTFGGDSYAFAKDKPIGLIDGSNLLHMLGRHGIRGYIDIASARTMTRPG